MLRFSRRESAVRVKKLHMDFNKTFSEEEEERAREPSVTLWCEGAFILFYCAMLTDKIVDWPTVQHTLSRSLRPNSS